MLESVAVRSTRGPNPAPAANGRMFATRTLHLDSGTPVVTVMGEVDLATALALERLDGLQLSRLPWAQGARRDQDTARAFGPIACAGRVEPQRAEDLPDHGVRQALRDLSLAGRSRQRQRQMSRSSATLVLLDPPPFVCSSTNDGLHAAWLRAAGKLDVAATAQLEQLLRKPSLQARLVVLDLRELSYIDASGVYAIATTSVRARQARRRLVVLRGPPEVDSVFELMGRSDEIEILDFSPVEPPVQALLKLVGANRAGHAVVG